MRILLTLLLLLVSIGVQCKAETLEVVSISEYGDKNNRANLVFLADGYLASQKEKFLKDVKTITHELFTKPPFSAYQDFINVYAIPTASKQEGVSVSEVALVDNYFGSFLGHYDLAQFLWVTDEERVFDTVVDNFPEFDQIVILVNTPLYGGGGGQVAIITNHAKATDLLIHEVGHSFGHLADEYWAGKEFAEESANMTHKKHTDFLSHSWDEWLGFEEVNLFPFDENGKWYRPHQNCIMRKLGLHFCPVCRQTMIEEMQHILHPIDDAKVVFNEQDQTYKKQRVMFKLFPIVDHCFLPEWKLNNQPIQGAKHNWKLEMELDVAERKEMTIQAVQFNRQFLSPSVRKHPNLFHTVSFECKEYQGHFSASDIVKSTISIEKDKDKHIEIVARLEKESPIRIEAISEKGEKVWSVESVSNVRNTVDYNTIEENKACLKFYKGQHCFATWEYNL